MTDWILINHDTGRPLNGRHYIDEITAHQDIMRLGETFTRLYWAVPAFTNPYWHQTLLEGFKEGDLEGIILPQFSVDLYVPNDPKTQNVVVGFLIKGVPEAVFPFKNFCTYSTGVKHVDYGDSDTLPHTSIVYVEFDRERFHPPDFDNLVHDVGRLAGLAAEDFSVNFPNTNKTYPYTIQVIEKYFRNRNDDKNRLAQLAAVQARTKQIQSELEKEMGSGVIGQRLGGQPGTPTAKETGNKGFKKLHRVSRPVGRLAQTKRPSTEVDDAVKNMIVNDAKRNLGSHTEKWEQFDNRWASRLRITPSRISSIRKKVYDL